MNRVKVRRVDCGLCERQHCWQVTPPYVDGYSWWTTPRYPTHWPTYARALEYVRVYMATRRKAMG